jgi:hypothetical protein
MTLRNRTTFRNRLIISDLKNFQKRHYENNNSKTTSKKRYLKNDIWQATPTYQKHPNVLLDGSAKRYLNKSGDSF